MSSYKKKHIITSLIEQGEGLQLDFKFEVSDAAKIARSLVAFANTVGGKLLIGVNDDGTISGVKSEEELFMIENAATRYCSPKVEFISRNWRINGKNVLAISVSGSPDAPHKAPNQSGEYKVYVRIDDENILANGVQMKIWKKLNTSSDINFVYSEDAKAILELLVNQVTLSLDKILSIINLSRFKIENILAELVIMKVINMTVDIDTVLFSLMDPEC